MEKIKPEQNDMWTEQKNSNQNWLICEQNGKWQIFNLAMLVAECRDAKNKQHLFLFYTQESLNGACPILGTEAIFLVVCDPSMNKLWVT